MISDFSCSTRYINAHFCPISKTGATQKGQIHVQHDRGGIEERDKLWHRAATNYRLLIVINHCNINCE